MAHNLPSFKVFLFSPQVFHQNYGGMSVIFGDQVEIYITNWNHTYIPIDIFESNVPIVQNSMYYEAEKKKYEFSLGGNINFAGRHHFLDALLCGTTPTNETLDRELSTYSEICWPFVGTAFNANLSGPQKELLIWHWKPGNSMHCIQELMQHYEAYESSGVFHKIPPFITPIIKSTPNLKAPPFCQTFQLACSKCFVPKVNHLTKSNLINRVLWLEVPPKLTILSLLTNILSTYQADCYQVMAEKFPIISFMVHTVSWCCYWSYLGCLVGNAVCCDKFKKYVMSLSLHHYE